MTRPLPSVLVVDDEPELRDSVRQILEAEGYRVETASNGVEALAALEAGRRPKLILLDLMMPVMNGYQLLDALASDPSLADIPVTVVSATANGANLGTPPRLGKPIDFDRLLALVAARCGAPT